MPVCKPLHSYGNGLLMAKAKPWTVARLMREALDNENVEARDVPGKGRGLFTNATSKKATRSAP
jgi:hypothetical protein